MTSTPDSTDIYRQLESYNWDKDAEFQGGLSAILGNATSPDQIHELTLRAQCFYLSRKLSVPVDFDAYKAYLSSTPTSHDAAPQAAAENANAGPRTDTSSQAPPVSATMIPAGDGQIPTDIVPKSDKGAAPYPPTFAEIVELITSGKPIPGIKEIPQTLLTDQASRPTASKRRKPWETDVSEAAVQGAGFTLPGSEGEGKKVEGTFGDHRDEAIVQDLPEQETASNY